eukprot:jgi/Ulvmu1/5949/UM026_0071.1
MPTGHAHEQYSSLTDCLHLLERCSQVLRVPVGPEQVKACLPRAVAAARGQGADVHAIRHFIVAVSHFQLISDDLEPRDVVSDDGRSWLSEYLLGDEWQDTAASGCSPDPKEDPGAASSGASCSHGPVQNDSSAARESCVPVPSPDTPCTTSTDVDDTIQPRDQRLCVSRKTFTFKVQGVSFKDDQRPTPTNANESESHQDLLKRLKEVLTRKPGPKGDRVQSTGAGQPVLMVHEPDNPHNSEAVAVLSPVGQIGYVPRSETHRFRHACTLGYTTWIGPYVPHAFHGCNVGTFPEVPAPFVQVIPPQLAKYIDVKRWLAPAVWERLEAHVKEDSQGRCHVTGSASGSLPSVKAEVQLGVRVFPLWSLDFRTGVLKLTGFRLLCTPVLCALAMLDLKPATASLQGEEGAVPQQRSAAQHGAPQLPREGEGVLEGLLRELAAGHGCCKFALRQAQVAARSALRDCMNERVGLDSGGRWVQNDWGKKDVKQYLDLCGMARRRCTGKRIGLDVSWLVAEGFATWGDVPPAVRRLQPQRSDGVDDDICSG